MFCRLLILFGLIPTTVCYGLLNIIIPGHDKECLYLEKEKGDVVKVSITVITAATIDLAVFSPSLKLLLREKSIAEHTINENAEETGAYMFCMENNFSYKEIILGFEYDYDDLQAAEGRLEKQVKTEKRKFINQMVENHKPALIGGKPIQAVEESILGSLKLQRDATTNLTAGVVEELEASMLFMSLLADRMERYLEIHKKRMSRHIHLQEENSSRVMVYSCLLSVIVIAISFSQVVILKRFFRTPKV